MDILTPSQLIGSTGETLFESVLKKNKFDFAKASRKQDMQDHIDFLIHGAAKPIGIDVKGFKNGVSNHDLFLLEIKNVRGNEGWAFGKADLIAFQMPESFWMVKRAVLAKWLNEQLGLRSINGKIVQTEGENTRNKRAMAPDTYSRYDRPEEMVTNISKNELEQMVWQKWAV